MSSTHTTTADEHVRLGLIGYIAQSLVYAVIGYFFVQAAIAFESKTAKGPSGALIEVGREGGDSCCFGSSPSDFFAYRVFCVAEAKFRTPPDLCSR